MPSAQVQSFSPESDPHRRHRSSCAARRCDLETCVELAWARPLAAGPEGGRGQSTASYYNCSIGSLGSATARASMAAAAVAATAGTGAAEAPNAELTVVAPPAGTTTIDDDALGLHVDLHRSWLGPADASRWWRECAEHVRWYRVKYKSARFKNDCETPCWTAFFGGMPQFVPYEPVPDWLQPLVAQVSQQCGGVPFNAMLVRLYFDGADEIAYHTDGRTFLGDTPTIASLSLGATAQFQMRRMTNVWPCGGDDGVDHSTPRRDFSVSNGDLLVMRGDTQKHWHHRVPKARARRPRININFRYIIPGSPDAERGQQTYYKYMVRSAPSSFAASALQHPSAPLRACAAGSRGLSDAVV